MKRKYASAWFLPDVQNEQDLAKSVRSDFPLATKAACNVDQ